MKFKIEFLYATITIFLWGTVATVGKLLLTTLDNYQVLFYVMLSSLIAVFILSIIMRKIKIIKKYKRKDYTTFFFLGAAGTFMYSLLFYIGLKFSSAQEAFTINYTWPIWVIILASLFLKEKITFKKILAIILSFIGVLVIVSQGQLSINYQNIFGNIIMLFGAFFYGLFSILGKKYKYETMTSMLFYFLTGTVLSFITMILFSNFIIPTPIELLGFIWLGGIATGVAYLFWFLALKHGDTGVMANLVFLTPFISLVFIAIFLKEKILISSFVGLILIISGILIQSFFKNKQP
jgi:drug/metabolite transporter (DMT)-like permease